MQPVEVRNLRKVYEFRTGLSGKKNVVAVDDISFEIGSGEVFGLLGPNGAGKTTTIKMLCTLVTPTSGEIWINGKNVERNAQEVRSSLGVMLAGERNMYWKLTGKENLQYFAALYHLRPAVAKKSIETTLKLVSLSEVANMPVENYSTGMKIRLSFAKALLNDAPVLLFDEPSMSLDPQSARFIRSTILDLRDRAKSILLTTHNLEEADQLCDRIGIVDHGKIIAMGEASQLKRSHRDKTVIKIRLKSDVETARRLISAIEGVSSVSLDSEPTSISVVLGNNPEMISSLLGKISSSDIRISGISVIEPSLEDVFIDLTGREFRD